MANMTYRHIFVYEDEIVLGPLAKIWLDNDDEIDVWSEILQVGMSMIIGSPTSSKITISPKAWSAIKLYCEYDRYGGMELHDFLNKMLTSDPLSLK